MMDPVPEMPYNEHRKSDDRRQTSSQQSPRHSMLFDDQGRPVARAGARSTLSSVESTNIPDANTLKRKLHNLFISGPSLRSRQSDGSLGSTASASPVSTGSPMEWPSGDLTPTTSSAPTVFPPESYRSRDISLEEELQARLAQMGDTAQSWQTKWHQEREDTCRLSDHLARCETESKRLIESVSNAYNKKIRTLEDTLMRSMKTNEQLLLEKELLESRLKQSKEIIDLQRHEIEKEFARARKDVELLRTEVGNMQSRTQRLEKENDSLKAEKQLLSNDLNMFTGNTKKFNITMKETDIRCELYRVLLEITLQKLKTLESNGGELFIEERAKISKNNRGRYVLRVDSKDPTLMHVEDVYEKQKMKDRLAAESQIVHESRAELSVSAMNNAQPVCIDDDTAKHTSEISELIISKPQSYVLNELEIKESAVPKTRYLPVVHMTSEAYSQGVHEKLNRSHSPLSPQHWGRGTPLRKADREESFSPESSEERSKQTKKNRRFSFGKDKPKHLIKHLSGGTRADPTEVLAANKAPTDEGKIGSSVFGRPRAKSSFSKFQDLPGHPHSLDNSFSESFGADGGEVLDLRSQVHQRRPRSLSESEDMKILLDETTTEYTDGKGSTYIDITKTTYRQRSNTLDGNVEKPKKNNVVESFGLTDSPTSSNEELRNSRTSSFEALRSRRNGFSGLSSSPESTGGKSFMIRKYKAKDISDLFKVFTSDKDGGGKDLSKGTNKKKGRFGK